MLAVMAQNQAGQWFIAFGGTNKTTNSRDVRCSGDCVAKHPLMRIANHDSVGGDGIGWSGA